jgi:hypothetical protein
MASKLNIFVDPTMDHLQQVSANIRSEGAIKMWRDGKLLWQKLLTSKGFDLPSLMGEAFDT